jgi:hypothetical protein
VTWPKPLNSNPTFHPTFLNISYTCFPLSCFFHLRILSISLDIFFGFFRFVALIAQHIGHIDYLFFAPQIIQSRLLASFFLTIHSLLWFVFINYTFLNTLLNDFSVHVLMNFFHFIFKQVLLALSKSLIESIKIQVKFIQKQSIGIELLVRVYVCNFSMILVVTQHIHGSLAKYPRRYALSFYKLRSSMWTWMFSFTHSHGR